ncbi:MAG: saccharopine dehydrogenase C-terminal domain-containing protein [Thermoplasmata archaeon]
MKIVQLGCGICGLVCGEHLSKNPEVSSLVLADMRTEAAEAAAKRLGSDKVDVMKVDGTDRNALRHLLADRDIVVAAMPWRLNRIVMEVAAETGTHYVDFGMPFDGTGPEFDRYSEMCKVAGISALVGMGMEPGMSDVFAMYGASLLDRADEAHVYDGDVATVEGLEFFSSWSPVDMFDEVSVPAAVFRNGRMEFIPPMSHREIYEFPPPVGKQPVYKTNHDETYFMPMGIKTLKEASFNISIDDKFAQAAEIFRKFGLLSKEPLDVKGIKVRPIDVVAALMPSPVEFADKIRGDACFVVEVIGIKDGRRTKVKLWTGISYQDAYQRLRTNATGYMVGTGGAIATEMLIDGEVGHKGIVIPEQLPHESFLRRMREKGIEVHQEISVL